MDFFDFIGNALRDTFIYFKSRTKKKYEGDRFEEWVVTHSNVFQKDKNTKGYWTLLEWRSDKYVSGWYPLSNLGPDLIFRSYDGLRIICVECKYRNSKPNFFLDKKQVINYELYCQATPYKISALYYLFGFQWKDNDPVEVYLVPSTAIYTYNSESETITFHNKTKDIKNYRKYQVILNPAERKKYIQYKETQQEV